LLWTVVPYATLLTVALGTVWRYRYDKFGWTTRSSQLYETNVLRWGSPMFHVGILFVLIGHVGGLLVPKAWTEAVGISERAYHLMATFLGTVAGVLTVVGLAVLIARRRLVGPVFAATTRNDNRAGAAGHRARQRARLRLRLPGDRVALVPVDLHAATPQRVDGRGADRLPAAHPGGVRPVRVLPFTRLIHAFSAPVGYLTRPYVVYRSRDPLGSGRRGPVGWDGRR
jgi:nitrate reductase gamma subunit